MDAIDEIIDKTTLLYHTDTVFHALVEQSIMVAFSHQVIPVSSDNLEKIREALKISAGVALILNEYEEIKAALERRKSINTEELSEEWCVHFSDVEIRYEITVDEPGINRKWYTCRKCVAEHLFLAGRYGRLMVERK